MSSFPKRAATLSSVLLASSLALVPALTMAQAAAPKAAASSPSLPDEYRLGAGDVVRITVYQNPDLSLEARVSEAGVISYPLLGTIRLGGQTVGQIEKRIADGLKDGNFVKQPQVSVMVTTVRGNQASVLGQVNRPGRFPIEEPNLHLSDLLAIAGGVAPTGAETVTIVSNKSGRPARTEIDLPKLFDADRKVEDPIIQNGDVVWIDRAPIVYIYGEVQRPGALRLERGMTVMQALASGGGLTQRGTEKGMRVHRKGPDGKTTVVQPGMDDPLRDGDVVYVKESLF